MKRPQIPIKPELTPLVVIGAIIVITILAVGGIFYFAGFFSSTSSVAPSGHISVTNTSTSTQMNYRMEFSNLSVSSINVSNLVFILNVSTSSGIATVILDYAGNNTWGSPLGVQAYWVATSSSGIIKDGSSITITYTNSPGFGGSIKSTTLYGYIVGIEVYLLGNSGGELAYNSV
ncbi:MAG: hypothetical protein M1605_01490 [Candidatus Thermoplasmatota archaeon]|nr:hypothetical protein [Candidatus Thermoplasmatota archaeon]